MFRLLSLLLLLASPELATRLETAERSYNLTVAEAVLAEVDAAGDSERALKLQALLLVGNLHRYEFERLPESAYAERRKHGDRIDEVAGRGLELLQTEAQSSERLRVMADFLGLMIRNDHRARKHGEAMKQAAQQAHEADPRNPRALVSLAKPAIFAPPAQGRDYAEALRLLDAALTLSPDLEQARLLRAHVLKETGDRDGALLEWRKAVELNPACRPALDEIAAAGK